MHQCPGKDCTVQVESDQLACKPHWFQLPAELRSEIWAAYRRRRSNPGEHAAVVRRAIAFWGSK